MKKLKVIIIFVAFFNCVLILAQELPPVQNFSPVDYNAQNQNWSISQASDNLVYVANDTGLLEFNGANWTLYSSPNESIMRSVKVVGNRIYTGCYMEFGFWQKDDFGILQYTSLSKGIKNSLFQDEEFWNILTIDDFLLFQSLNRIYIYDQESNSVNTIDSNTTIPKMWKLDQSIYFQKISEGIYKIKNGKEILVYDDDVVRNDEVVTIFQKEGDLLILTRHLGIYRAHQKKLEKLITPSESIFSEVSVYSGLQLQDGGIALGTISHGLIHLDAEWKLKYRINETKGIRNNTVLSMFEDSDQNLWLGLDNGISYVNLNTPFSVYFDNRGVVGSVYASAIKGDMMYLGTNQGLFYKSIFGDNEFKLIQGTQGQVWSLNQIGSTLFCGHHTGTFVVEGVRVKKVAGIPGTWKIGAIDNNPELLMQGNYNGLYVLEKQEGDWQLKNKIEGFNHSARFFEVFENEIYVNHEYKGIFRIETNLEYSLANQVTIDTTMKGARSGIVKYKGDLLYSYRNGVYRYDGIAKKFSKDSLLSKAYNKEDYVSGKLLVDNKAGYLWVFTKSNIRFISEENLQPTPKISGIPLSEKVRNNIAGYENVTGLQDDGKYLFGNGSGYITVNTKELNDQDFRVELGSINLFGKDANSSDRKRVNPNIKGKFKNEENHLEISFYTARYNKFLKPKYQYRLTGLYENWSEWSEQAFVVVENLPFGEYDFLVRAKIGNQISSNISSFSFQIARPWYLSTMMLVFYAATTLIVLVLIHYSYRRYYHKKQKNIIESTQKKLELVRLQNEQDIIKLKNDQLREDFRNKSNELAASTMSIIKKNELLSRVKDQLVSEGEKRATTKEIVRVIDRNLNQNDDWELFKEAFNNADRKFLKKLEKTHPNLTHNDIRLCAYLRLNLVSKEIAQLLNISPRSVEIKRYRLRKKLNLKHDENLVNYILRL